LCFLGLSLEVLILTFDFISQDSVCHSSIHCISCFPSHCVFIPCRYVVVRCPHSFWLVSCLFMFCFLFLDCFGYLDLTPACLSMFWIVPIKLLQIGFSVVLCVIRDTTSGFKTETLVAMTPKCCPFHINPVLCQQWFIQCSPLRLQRHLLAACS